MKISKQARRDAKELFRHCLVNGVLDEDRVRRAVQATLRARPRQYLGMLGHFQRLVKLELARRSARVETAGPLEPALQTQVREQLGRAYGPGLAIAFGENPMLIGGMRIQVGSDVYDGSIHARLDRLLESF